MPSNTFWDGPNYAGPSLGGSPTAVGGGLNDYIDARLRAGLGSALQSSGVPTLPAYLGHVATGTAHPTTLRTSGAPTQANFRSVHVMREAVSSFQIGFRNYYRETEAGGGAPLTITAAIEYPVGTFTQVKWSGSATLVIANGVEGPLSDPVALSIPIGAQFYVRSFHQMSTGIMHTAYNGAPGNGTQGEFGTGALADKTMGGTIPQSNNFCPPALIAGTTTKPSFALVGDSLSVGIGEGAPDATPDIGFARSLAAVAAYQKQAVGGETMANFMGANGTKRRAMIAYASHIACFYGRNDINVSNGAQLLADRMTALAALFPGKPLIASTITPGTTSTDSWATTTNQTVLAFESERVKYNEMLRGFQIPGVLGFVDHAVAVESSLNSGLWTPGLVFTTDNAGVHANTAGQLAIRQANIQYVRQAAQIRA